MLRPLARNSALEPRIVIVGAGAAGTTCAYRLHQAGLSCAIFDANSRSGGRTWTNRGFFKDGQYAEHGGQLIASSQHSVRRLAAELGLQLLDLNALYPPDAADTYFIAGVRYTHDEAAHDYDRYVYDPLNDAAKAAGYPTTYFKHTAAGVALDRMSVNDWLDANVSHEGGAKIAALLRLACLSEYGGELRAQSALNLVYLLAGMRHGRLDLSGSGEDDRFTIDGGNDQLVERMIAVLPPRTLTLETGLEALARNTDGSYTCTFTSGAKTKSLRADIVVIATPFTVLRRVETRRAGFSRRKQRAIDSLDLGSNAKIHLQFDSPYWLKERYSGSAYADRLFQDAWDTSIGQRGRAGMLVCFPGGEVGAHIGGSAHGAAPADTARAFVNSLEAALPGATREFNGLAYQDFWFADPLTHGAYSYYKTGQYSTLCGEERVSEGSVYFCGEQTSINWQGYINGAVESGERAAREILQDLGLL
ncbi:MAG TPA: NAD(P)/FAD-dependent oxidoreductase, partial [Candidatus Nitrosotalea sp.]|nr:NAD(P)/FAD-dependent oxidoreductase [Candidatus Nitrosotalea sp.]